MRTWLLVAQCILFHICTVTLLAIRRRQLSFRDEKPEERLLAIPALLITVVGTLAVAYTFWLPYGVSQSDPMVQCVLRIVCFFYGCKLLDLALARSTTPPVRIEAGKNDGKQNAPVLLHSFKDFAVYVWLLLSEMRYHNFDIAVVQRGRPDASEQSSNVATPFAATLLVGVLDLMNPLPELKCIHLLLILRVAFELLHSTLHPRCKHPLFYKPFSAASMSSFWTTHWHAGATPFLQSLAYRPARKYVGRWFGVLATFALSGVWHAWASAVLVEDEYSMTLALQVWALFEMMSLVCLAERWIWGGRQGGMVQRIVVWTLPILYAGQCFRNLQQHTTVEMLRARPS